MARSSFPSRLFSSHNPWHVSEKAENQETLDVILSPSTSSGRQQIFPSLFKEGLGKGVKSLLGGILKEIALYFKQGF